ncbi:hypothetical protein LguiA_022582 [Lonicera macranthoides]
MIDLLVGVWTFFFFSQRINRINAETKGMFGNVFGECFSRMFSENENEKMNFPRKKIVKTFSENENIKNEDCKTENGENIILAFLRFML